jgi:hypothetical protein
LLTKLSSFIIKTIIITHNYVSFPAFPEGLKGVIRYWLFVNGGSSAALDEAGSGERGAGSGERGAWRTEKTVILYWLFVTRWQPET